MFGFRTGAGGKAARRTVPSLALAAGLLLSALGGPSPTSAQGPAAQGAPNVGTTAARIQVGIDNVLQVRASTTGKVVGTVATPSGCMIGTFNVTAYANDRDFIVSCLKKTPRLNAYFGLRISSHGAPSRPTPLPIHGTTAATVTGLALTPDGRRLAIGLNSRTGQHATIELVTLATGASKSS